MINLSLQLASQVGYVAESKVARGESTAWMSSKSQPFGDCNVNLTLLPPM